MYEQVLRDKLGAGDETEIALPDLLAENDLSPPAGILDCHLHACDNIANDNHALHGTGAPLEQNYPPLVQEEILAAAGVTDAVLVQMVDPTDDGRQGAHIREGHKFAAWVEENQWIRSAVVAADLERGPKVAQSEIETWGKIPSISGIRIVQTQEARGVAILQSSEFHQAVKLLANHNLHHEWLVREGKGQLQPMLDAIKAVGDDVLHVIDHLGKPVGINVLGNPSGHWKLVMKEVAKNDRVWMKLSALSGEAPQGTPVERYYSYLDQALRYFGPDRCFFGGDWFVSALRGTYNDSLCLYMSWAHDRGFDQELIQKIFRDNGIRFYGHRDNNPLAIGQTI